MTEENVPAEKTKPWLWPVEWFQDEKFWREVTARMMSILLAGLVIAFVGVMTGLIDIPAVRAILALIIFIAVGVIAVFSSIFVVHYQYKKFAEEHGPGSSEHFKPSFKLRYLIPTMIVLFVALVLLQQALQYWGGWSE